MLWAKQSTAKTVTVGPVLDASGVAVTDGVVGDFKISKNGGAPAALNGSATLTHRHTGHYSLALTASDLDTLGTAEVTIDDTVNSCGIKELMVVPANVYDSLVLGTDYLDANAAQVGGQTASLAGDWYYAEITLTVDSADSEDRWCVTWFKNGVTLTSGITSPTLTVDRLNDDNTVTNLLNAQALTESGTLETFTYGATTTARVTVGLPVKAVASATIDSATRTFSRVLSRDSS